MLHRPWVPLPRQTASATPTEGPCRPPPGRSPPWQRHCSRFKASTPLIVATSQDSHQKRAPSWVRSPTTVRIFQPDTSSGSRVVLLAPHTGRGLDRRRRGHRHIPWPQRSAAYAVPPTLGCLVEGDRLTPCGVLVAPSNPYVDSVPLAKLLSAPAGQVTIERWVPSSALPTCSGVCPSWLTWDTGWPRGMRCVRAWSEWPWLARSAWPSMRLRTPSTPHCCRTLDASAFSHEMSAAFGDELAANRAGARTNFADPKDIVMYVDPGVHARDASPGAGQDCGVHRGARDAPWDVATTRRCVRSPRRRRGGSIWRMGCRQPCSR